MDAIQFSLVLLYLAVGITAGTISGLFGVGGGLVMVPALVYSFELIGIADQLHMHMAVSTSMAIIVINSTSSAFAHYRKGNLHLPAFILLVPGTVAGAASGTLLLQRVDDLLLQWLFVVFLICISMYMMFNRQPEARRQLPSAPTAFVGAGAIGSISAMLGIGGGSFFVPWMCWCSLEPKKAVGTSALLGLPLSLMAVLVNLLSDVADKATDSPMYGYIYLPAFFAMLVTGPFFAIFGARLASRLPPAMLKKSFALFLLLIAADFIARRIL